MKRMLFWLVLIGLFVGALWLILTFRENNSVPIDLDLIWIRIPNLEVWSLILGSIGLGASLSLTVVGFAWMRGRLLNSRYRRAIKRLESELHEMRSLPLAGSRKEDPETLGLNAPQTIATAERS